MQSARALQIPSKPGIGYRTASESHPANGSSGDFAGPGRAGFEDQAPWRS